MAVKHLPIGSKISQVLGFFNTICSIVVLWYYYALKFYKKMNFARQLVLLVTIAQLVQDAAIAYHTLCPEIRKWDDDEPWIPSKENYPYQCNASQWWTEQFSGVLLQSMILFMILVVFYIVLYGKPFDVKRWLPWWFAFFGLVAVAFASLDVWGSYECDKISKKTGKRVVAYICPETPGINSNQHGLNHWAPGFVGYIGGYIFRIALALLSLFFSITVWCMLARFYRTNDANHAVIRELVRKLLWYPTVQCLTRVPNAFQLRYGTMSYIDDPKGEYGDVKEGHAEWHAKLVGFYLQVVCDTMGGLFMLIVFIRVNREAQSYNRAIYRRCKSILAWLFCGEAIKEVARTSVAAMGRIGAGKGKGGRSVNTHVKLMNEGELMECVGRTPDEIRQLGLIVAAEAASSEDGYFNEHNEDEGDGDDMQHDAEYVYNNSIEIGQMGGTRNNGSVRIQSNPILKERRAVPGAPLSLGGGGGGGHCSSIGESRDGGGGGTTDGDDGGEGPAGSGVKSSMRLSWLVGFGQVSKNNPSAAAAAASAGGGGSGGGSRGSGRFGRPSSDRQMPSDGSGSSADVPPTPPPMLHSNTSHPSLPRPISLRPVYPLSAGTRVSPGGVAARLGLGLGASAAATDQDRSSLALSLSSSFLKTDIPNTSGASGASGAFGATGATGVTGGHGSLGRSPSSMDAARAAVYNHNRGGSGKR